ncbi:AAA family ATPase [Bradyrhizobium sp. GCM10027634]|uniref:AAA family ATPase n=1 Tax=unclassified Bradyrhizobium TaxID=2631580 RepID=UPI00188C43D7|nr:MULTISPECIES: AAA family ATPase [unclassified Bradyrhizobium]MDN5005806.1 AAA family ATPase [Bradyrhizobium sp. WYCCWR 12677]QOZ44427.1 kinase [Bradyrhizobium sp. CCBAU 53340]
MTSHRPPALIVFGGLPGTGKTAISRKLATRLAATYLRIDAIEQGLRQAGLAVGPTGYAIANALAAENLKIGRPVVADCVNPVFASRAGWQQTALQSSACIIEIEMICTDLSLHRQRVESRSPDVSGQELPGWDEIVNRDYEPWDQEHLVLDAAVGTVDDLVEQAKAYVRGKIGDSAS